MTTAVSAPVTPERIYQFAFGYAPPLVLEAAIRHRVFDVLDSGSKSLHEIHKATGASERGLADSIFLPRTGRATIRSRRKAPHFWSAPSPSFRAD
jgi:hypothetical protein